MPIYEYECQKCHGLFEVVQKFSDKPKRSCDTCGGRLKKLISAAAFHLKGTGWYATDYAAKGKQETSDKSDKAEKTPSSDKTTDAPKKEAAKPEASTSKAVVTK